MTRSPALCCSPPPVTSWNGWGLKSLQDLPLAPQLPEVEELEAELSTGGGRRKLGQH